MSGANDRIRLRVYEYEKGKNIPGYKKTLGLPIYLQKQDDFAMFIAKHCGCHFFHVSYSNSDKKTRRLCDIKITSTSKKHIEYTIPFPEDMQRLTLILKRNKKSRHLMKETTGAGKKRQLQHHTGKNTHDSMYG